MHYLVFFYVVALSNSFYLSMLWNYVKYLCIVFSIYEFYYRFIRKNVCNVYARCILTRPLELRARSILTRLLEPALPVPNQANGAWQMRFLRAARCAAVGDALNLESSRHGLI